MKKYYLFTGIIGGAVHALPCKDLADAELKANRIKPYYEALLAVQIRFIDVNRLNFHKTIFQRNYC